MAFITGYLFAYTGFLDEEQISDVLDEISEKLKIKKKDKYISVAKEKNGDKMCFSYIWCNTELYNAIIGLNLDGSERIEVKPIVVTSVIQKPISTDWGDSEIYCSNEIIRLPSLVQEIPKKRYTEEQKKEILKYDKILYSAKLRECTVEEVYEKDHNKDYEIKFMPLEKIEDSEDFTNKIYTRSPPEWLTEKILVRFFSKFNTDNFTYKDRNNSTYKYPKVSSYTNKKGEKIFTIEFSIRQNDIEGVCRLCKVIYFKESPKPIFFSRERRQNKIK
jgi:hypothetical protein